MNSRKSRVSSNGKYAGETLKSAILTGSLESRENSSKSSSVHKSEVTPIEIVGQGYISSFAFLVDGKHVVSGGQEGKIRRWRVEDGKEVETPMDAGSAVNDIAVSRDGKSIVCGTASGELTVWDGNSHKKVIGWQGHGGMVYAVDVSPDGKRIASGSYDRAACVWSLSTGQRLLGPLEHNASVTTAKFSPDGRLIAVATWRGSVLVYDSQNGHLLVDVPIRVADTFNQSLLWASNSKNLFACSRDGKVEYLDTSTGTTLSSWRIHSSKNPGCIALASNGTFIAASDNSSVSFWDTATHKQIGSIIDHPYDIGSIAISANDDIVIGGGPEFTLRNLRRVFPSFYHEDVSALASNICCEGFVFNEKPFCELRQMLRKQEIQRMKAEKVGLEATIQSLHIQEESSSVFITTPTCTSLMLIFTRKQHCGSPPDRPATP